MSVGQVSQWISSRVSLSSVRRQGKPSRRRPRRAHPVHHASRRRRRRWRRWSTGRRRRSAAAGDARSSQSVRSTTPAHSNAVDRSTVSQRTASPVAKRQEMRTRPMTPGRMLHRATAISITKIHSAWSTDIQNDQVIQRQLNRYKRDTKMKKTTLILSRDNVKNFVR